jgi:hypothetical protein
MSGTLATHIATRAIAQLLIDKRSQTLERTRIAGLPGREQSRDRLPVRWRGNGCCNRVAQTDVSLKTRNQCLN